MTSATLTLDGLTVLVRVERSEDGPLLTLTPQNCNLEGDAPGEYLLTPLNPEEAS